MKDLRSKKAIAASLSLTLALGSVPAVALADDADENSEGATSEQPAAQGQNLEVIAFFQGGGLRQFSPQRVSALRTAWRSTFTTKTATPSRPCPPMTPLALSCI